MLNERGHEIVSNEPVAAPVNFRRPPSLNEQIMRLVKGEFSRQAQMQGQESFEEADDFEIGDDYDPSSPYEMDFDHDQNIEALEHQVRENRSKRFKQEKPNVEPEQKAPVPDKA